MVTELVETTETGYDLLHDLVPADLAGSDYMFPVGLS